VILPLIVIAEKQREIMFPYGAEETLHKKMETEQRWGTEEENQLSCKQRMLCLAAWWNPLA